MQVSKMLEGNINLLLNITNLLIKERSLDKFGIENIFLNIIKSKE